MNKMTLLILATVIVPMFIIAAAYSQEDMTYVDNDIYPNPQRVPSEFNHEEHNEIAEIEDCTECHHVYEEGIKLEDESSEDQRCSECHGFKASGRTPGLTKAYHTNCKGCHLKQKKGPIMCGECHVKG
jgi:hypothetical protein